jgi:hypothetical protein
VQVAAAIELPEWRARRRLDVFRAIAALALASTTAHAPSTLTSAVPWWERVTVTVTDDGQAHSCRYESSLRPNNGQDCAVVANRAATAQGAGARDQYTRITFERRFSPGAAPDTAAPQAGETLLGGRVMALAIDAKGAVKGCKVVATSGSMAPQYGCDDLAAERFEASASNARAPMASREGTMTILVYGHSEHIV